MITLRRILRHRLRLALIALLTGAIAAAVLLFWLGMPIGDLLPEAEAALRSDGQVAVSKERWLVFRPRDGQRDPGFILYPGGRVAPEAYAPLGRALAQNGHIAVLVPMPLNLAVLDPHAADAVIAAFPQVERWVIAGHSLGGVMAARYAYEYPERLAGLALMAAWPEAHIDLRERDLAVAALYGDRDDLATVEEVEASFGLLPADARKALIAGGNHAQFGWYGLQAGDGTAQISREEQLATVLQVLLDLARESGG